MNEEDLEKLIALFRGDDLQIVVKLKSDEEEFYIDSSFFITALADLVLEELEIHKDE